MVNEIKMPKPSETNKCVERTLDLRSHVWTLGVSLVFFFGRSSLYSWNRSVPTSGRGGACRHHSLPPAFAVRPLTSLSAVVSELMAQTP